MTRRGFRRLIMPAVQTAALAGAVLMGMSFEAVRAQGGAPVTLTDIKVETGAITYRIPRIEIRGGNLSDAEAKALFDQRADGSLAQRLARLSAQEVVVQAITIDQPLAGGRHSTTYRDIVLTGISAGRVASVAGEGGLFETIGVDKGAKGSFGRLAASDLDLAQSLAIYAEKAGSSPTEYRRLYGAFSLDNIVAAGPDELEIRIGRIAARDLRARPTADSWTETMRLIGSLGEKDALDEADQARALALAGDLLDAFEFGSLEMVDLESRAPAGSTDPRVKIARMSYASAQGGRPAEARLDGFDVTGPDVAIRIASIAVSDFSFAQMTAGFKTLGGRPGANLDPAEWRKFAPTLGTIRLSGLDANVSTGGPADGPAKPTHIRVGLRSFELAAEKPINGIPTDLRLVLDNLSFPVPQDAEESGMKDLVELGYRSVDVSTNISAAWNAALSELSLRDLSVRGANMGSLVLRGAFGNVSKDLFDTDTAIASVALVGATLKSAEIRIENAGLAERLLAQQAAAQKRSTEDLRREYGMTAAVGIPALIGNSAQAKALGSAIARFVAKPNRLTISARARDGVGLGAADLVLLGDPNALMSKIEVTAKAE